MNNIYEGEIGGKDRVPVEEMLRNAKIDTSEWGKNGNKSIQDLEKELDEGEASLEFDNEGNLFRKTMVCCAHISHTTADGIEYVLKEDRQVFRNGDKRKRDKPEAVSEKMKIVEDPKEAIIRGIHEELGIDIDFSSSAEVKKETKESGSYPGLNTEYNFYIFRIALMADQYKPDGYTEVGEKKTTYFVWERK